jgi:adenylate cyclase
MAQEFERRFLLPSMPDLGEVTTRNISQGYLNTDPERTVRIRLMDNQAFLTIKGKRVEGLSPEFEYEIPVDDAAPLLDMCGADNTLSKTRHVWHAPDGHIWEVDEFTGRHEGLVIAEVELPSASSAFQMAAWMNGVEVTKDNNFSNSNLLAVPRDKLKTMIDTTLNLA